MPQPQLRWVGVVFLIALLSACGGPGAPPPVLPPGMWGGLGFALQVETTYAVLTGGQPYGSGMGNISGTIPLDPTGAFDVPMIWYPCRGGVSTPTPGVDETPVLPTSYQERLRGVLQGNAIHLRDPRGTQEVAVLLPNARMTGSWDCE